MPKKWVNITIKEYCAATKTDYQFTCRVSDPNQIKLDLLAIINTRHAENLSQSLLSHFIYPKRGKHSSRKYRGDHHVRTWEYQQALTRPMIEALFIEYPEIFEEILDAVIASNDNAMKEGFLNCCKNTNVDFPKAIFHPLDEKLKEKLHQEFQALRELNPSSQKVQILADKLTGYLNDWPSGLSDLDALQYRMKFIKVLHSHDQHFAEEPNYKKICFNIITILFTGGFANLVNLHLTGNFWFFKQTASQKQIEKIDRKIELPLHEKPSNDNDEGLKPGDIIQPIYEPAIDNDDLLYAALRLKMHGF